eukprot:6173632-Pleurochrysis_carterae.AAC.13
MRWTPQVTAWPAIIVLTNGAFQHCNRNRRKSHGDVCERKRSSSEMTISYEEGLEWARSTHCLNVGAATCMGIVSSANMFGRRFVVIPFGAARCFGALSNRYCCKCCALNKV